MKKRLCIFILFALFISPSVVAQDDDFPPTDDPPVPDAPINILLPVLMLAGIGYAIRVTRKKNGI